jgi:HD-like signal output (HDOD) protein
MTQPASSTSHPVSLPTAHAASLALDGWVKRLRALPIPVLATTARAIETLRADADSIDARRIAEVVAADPLMTLKLFVHAGANRSRHATADVETVTAALVMLGIDPFFRAFGSQSTVEELLRDEPAALEGLGQVLHRSQRAAQFALGFAVHRQDTDAAVIHEAALLHDFAEMLLWCHAPAQALAIQHRQRADARLRSSVVQREVLHLELHDLQHALMLTWKLPELLVRITDEREARHPSVRSVLLATRLARHTSNGWDNAALPDDPHDIGELLNLAIKATLQLLRELDA